MHDDDDFRDEELEFEEHMPEAEIAALRCILARVAVLLRQGKVEQALAEIPVNEHEVFVEQLMGTDLPPRLGH
jgi:hypothetical protein